MVGGDSPLPSPNTYCSLVHVHPGCSPVKVEKERVGRWIPNAVKIESNEAVGRGGGGGVKMV